MDTTMSLDFTESRSARHIERNPAKSTSGLPSLDCGLEEAGPERKMPRTSPVEVIAGASQQYSPSHVDVVSMEDGRTTCWTCGNLMTAESFSSTDEEDAEEVEEAEGADVVLVDEETIESQWKYAVTPFHDGTDCSTDRVRIRHPSGVLLSGLVDRMRCEGAAIVAARAGYVEGVVAFAAFVELPAEVWLEAARHGHKDVLEWGLVTAYPTFHLEDSCAAACDVGNSDAAAWLVDNTLRARAAADNLETDFTTTTTRIRPSALFKFVRRFLKADAIDDALYHATAAGQLDVVKAFAATGFIIESNLWSFAAETGRTDLLQWAFSKQYPTLVMDAVVKEAAACGRKEVLEWALEHGISLEGAEDSARAGNYVRLARWIDNENYVRTAKETG